MLRETSVQCAVSTSVRCPPSAIHKASASAAAAAAAAAAADKVPYGAKRSLWLGTEHVTRQSVRRATHRAPTKSCVAVR